MPLDLACERNWLNSEESLLTAWRKSAEGKVGEGNEPEEKPGWPHIAEDPMQIGPRSVEVESEPGTGHCTAVALLPLPRAAELGRLTENT